MACIQVLDEGTSKERYKVSYEIKTLDGSRKRKAKTFKHGVSKREVLKFKRKVEEEYDVSQGIDFSCVNKTLKDFIDFYFENYAFSLSPSTLNAYKNCCYSEERGIIKSLGNMKLSKLSTRDIQGYVTELIQAGLSPKTIRNHIYILSAIINKAMVCNWIEKQYNICDNVVLPKNTPRKIDSLTMEEVRQLFKVVDEEDNFLLKLQVYIALLTGARRSEICALTIDDIDFKEKMITINKARVQSQGKTVLKETKTKNSVRKVPMPNKLCSIMKEAVRRYKLNRFKYGQDFVDSRCIFSNEDGTPEGVNTITSRHYRFYKRHEGELRYINFHGYRHTYASIAIASGQTDIKTVQEILGHANVGTTLDLYAVGYDEVKLDYATKLDEMIFSDDKIAM